MLGHCWLNTPNIHTSEWDSLFFHSCLLSTVTVTPSDSDYVNRSASVQRFRIIHTTLSWRSRIQFFAFVSRGACTSRSRRTKSLETVATRVVTVISHCIREVLACKRIMFMLRVMTHVVSYKLFWNWIGFVQFQFVSHEVLFDKGFVIWHFFFCFIINCVVVITEYFNSNHF